MQLNNYQTMQPQTGVEPQTSLGGVDIVQLLISDKWNLDKNRHSETKQVKTTINTYIQW